MKSKPHLIENSFFGAEGVKEIDGNYNPEVKHVIYEDDPDTCYGATDNNKVQCGFLIKIGQRTNMMSAMTLYQSYIAKTIKEYLRVKNTTMMQLTLVLYQNIGVLLPSFVVISFESQLIADIIDKTLEQKIQETKDNRSVIIVIFSLSLVGASVLFWVYILKRIREVYNDFKKVLQIFPPGLILSSFLLKKFLSATSSSGHFEFM